MTPKHTPLRAHATSHEDEGVVSVRAPKIGRFTPSVSAGQLIEPNQPLGTLEVLHQRFTLLAPPEARGRIRTLDAPARATPVEYDQALLHVELDVQLQAARDDARLDAEGEPLLAPMDGLFYRRASPDDPPFADEGDVIQPGDQIGLVEVMKFFYPFVYEGLEPTTLLRFAVEDATPIESGQIIAYLQS